MKEFSMCKLLLRLFLVSFLLLDTAKAFDFPVFGSFSRAYYDNLIVDNMSSKIQTGLIIVAQ